MKRIALMIGVVILALLLPLVKMEPQPEPDEPPLPMAPLPLLEPVVPISEPELPEPIKPEPLPSGAHCTSDCPLIDPTVVEMRVREYYADAPVLIAIAECESNFRHYDQYGQILKNKQGTSATGVMQIMASVHDPDAAALGLSIRDFYGNLAYARHLYDTQGTVPWDSSRNCWGTDTVAVNMVFPST